MNLDSSQMGSFPDTQIHSNHGNSTVSPVRVLVIGATGFIGSRIVRSLQARGDVHVSILARGCTRWSPRAFERVWYGDLMDVETVRNAVCKADVVINAASYVGNDAQMARQVNFEGTLSVIDAYERSNAQRLIQLSTTAIYGSGPHRAPRPWEAEVHPESDASRSRAEADQAVLSAGGIVVRPSLVHGSGDRWFIPGVVRMFRTLGTRIESGSALLSMIDVTDLGVLTTALAVTTSQVRSAYHAASPHPISLAQLLETIELHIGRLNIQGDATIEEAIKVLSLEGFSRHQVSMIGTDHYYESRGLWQLSNIRPTGFHFNSDTINWYRRQISVS